MSHVFMTVCASAHRKQRLSHGKTPPIPYSPQQRLQLSCVLSQFLISCHLWSHVSTPLPGNQSSHRMKVLDCVTQKKSVPETRIKSIFLSFFPYTWVISANLLAIHLSHNKISLSKFCLEGGIKSPWSIENKESSSSWEHQCAHSILWQPAS